MEAPFFWDHTKRPFHKILSQILWPLSCCYQVGAWIRSLVTQPKILPIKVICVGNLTLGGAGKTPTTIALAHILKTYFQQTPHVLTRGYKNALPKGAVHFVQSDQDQPQDVGDEPLLLGRHVPTWVSHNRFQSGGAAYNQGASIVILDDGLQNPSLHKDLKLLVIDGDQEFGNGYVFPAGPLRTTIKSGLKNADALIVIHPNPELLQRLQSFDKPIFTASFKAKLPIPPQPVVGFAGIGYPLKFKQALLKWGYDVKTFLSFPDHHVYTKDDLHFLRQWQNQYKAPLLTTEKDIIKIPESTQQKIYAVPITLNIIEEDAFLQFLEGTLKLDRLVSNAP